MKPITIKIASFYSLWVLLWIILLLTGMVDYSSSIVLTLSSLPLGLLALKYFPDAGIYTALTAGLIGLLQWSLVAELNSRFNTWRSEKSK